LSNLLNALGHGVPLELLAPAALTETTNGTGVDVSLYEGRAAAIIHSAAGTGTTPTMNVKLQTCSTVDGTYADISGATFTEIDDTAGGAIELISFDVSAAEAYVRAVATIAGTTPSFTCSCAFVGVLKTG